MCGIVGAIAERNIVPVLIEGLKRLEYRGYDSAGVAVLKRNHELGAACARSARSRSSRQKLASTPLTGQLGVAHTRWATHGGVTRGERASAPLRRSRRGDPQRHHRELRADQATS